MDHTDKMPYDTPDGGGASRRYGDSNGVRNVQWPLKLMRISSVSPYFHKAHLLLAADCSAFSYTRFDAAFGSDKTLVIGCPDAYGMDFYDKIAEIIRVNDILAVTLVRMDAPCCSRITDAVILAIRNSGKDIPLRLTTLFTEGEIVE